jgi:hypothetical protein
VKIPCQEINPGIYFRKGAVQAAFETLECSFDPIGIKNILFSSLSIQKRFNLKLNTKINNIKVLNDEYILTTDSGEIIKTPFVVNTTYASTNQINSLFGFNRFKIKYEICEISLCTVSSNLVNVGITVMDGPFFSIMPFGLTGRHSLSSVEFTPHRASFDELPTFNCQKYSDVCSPSHIDNCNLCPVKPKTAFPYMQQLTKKYLKESQINYEQALFGIKTILKASELDDSRPTIIKVQSTKPKFISVLSGKINTIYDLEGELV